MSMLIFKYCKGVEVEDTEHPGHPVRFKDENLASIFCLDSHSGDCQIPESMEDEMLAEMRKEFWSVKWGLI